MRSLRVINVLYHPPAYRGKTPDERPLYHAETSGGWVGTQGTEWPDLLGRAVVELDSEIEYEVWQPDPRADQPVSWSVTDRLTHTLFPARATWQLYGLRPQRYVWSEELARRFVRSSANHVMHVNSPFEALSQRLLGRQAHRPYLLEYHSATMDIARAKKRVHRNVAISLLYWRWEQSIRRLGRKMIVYKNSRQIGFLESCGAIRCEQIPMGCSFSVFRPGSKQEARTKLGFAADVCVLSMASRLVPLKQIDRVIEALAKLPVGARYCLVIAGHGDPSYTNHLLEQAGRKLPAGAFRLLGFLDDAALRSVLQASDLFISASKAEGGPVTVMNALACETPVMCTRVGGVDDLLARHSSGILVEPFDYESWVRELRRVVEGTRPPLLSRSVAYDHFDWSSIAARFISLYRQLAVT